MEKKEFLHIVVTGRVQGVFFRATTLKHAEFHGIFGTVQNKKDGSVEIFALGTKENLMAFIDSIKNNPGKGIVDKIQLNFIKTLIEYKDFKII